jgi:TetR/AcrR family transcriptional regulator, cholesterol catabolism regulator
MTTNRGAETAASGPGGRTATEGMILAEACQLFATRGFDGTSIRDIANAVGISNAALYHYFADKDELLARIVINVIERQCELMERRIVPGDPPAEKLRAFMRAYADFFEENMAESIASSRSFSALENPVQRERAIYWRDRYENMLRAIVQEGMDSGEFREGDVALTGRAVLSCLNWMYRWYSPSGSLRPQDIVDTYADILIGGISARQDRSRKMPKK